MHPDGLSIPPQPIIPPHCNSLVHDLFPVPDERAGRGGGQPDHHQQDQLRGGLRAGQGLEEGHRLRLQSAPEFPHGQTGLEQSQQP